MSNKKLKLNTWFISDQHFGHANIIKYTNRPVATVEEMEELIVTKHNSVVKKEDIVYCLGDFALGDCSVENIKRIVSRLNGNLILLMGNHDTKTVSFYHEVGFKNVYENPILLENLILSHAPVSTMHPGFINIHGHLHNLPLAFESNRHLNVCAEHIDYTPINIQEVFTQIYKDEVKTKKLYVTRGIPGAGKSTWIKKKFANIKKTVISPDELRIEIAGITKDRDGNESVSQSKDKMVWEIAIDQLKHSLLNNDITVFDATCTKEKDLIRYLNLCKQYNVELIVIDFSKLSLEDCKQTNATRLPAYERVPEEVIDRMYAQISKTIESEVKDFIYDFETVNI